MFESDYNFGVPNPSNAHEEHIKNAEAALEWAGPGHLKLSGSVFYNVFTDMLRKDNNPLSPTFGHYINTGNLRSIGEEVGVEKKWDGGEEFKLAFDHTEFLVYKGTSFGQLDSPTDVAKARFAMPLFNDKARLGIESLYVGRRRTLYQNTYARGYDIVNATLSSQNLLPGLDASFSVYNLFNSPHDMVGGAPVAQDVLPMNGRSVMLSLQKKF